MARDRNLPNKGDVQTFNGSEWVPLSFTAALLLAVAMRVLDSVFAIIDDADSTKSLTFQAGTQATGLTTTIDVGAQTGSYSASLPVMSSSSIFAMSAIAGTSGRIPFYTTNGLQTDSANLAWNNGAGSLAIGGMIAVTQGSISSAATAIGATTTWNNGAVTFDGINFVATLTANSADSRLLNLQTGAGRIYSVIADGTQVFSGAASAQPSSTYDTSCIIHRTGNAGSAPYNQAGSIVYRPQVSSVAGRSSHYFYTGSPSTLALKVDEVQRCFVGDIRASFKGNVLAGVQDATAAAAGQVGEVLSSTVTAAAVAATGTVGNITSLSLTAGDWLISGYCIINAGATGLTTGSTQKMSIVTTTATNGTNGSTMVQASIQALVANGLHHVSIPQIRININATTTYYLTEEITYAGGTPTAAGTIIATRIR